ncbi:GntR family transcriptional regulator [Geminicoccus roseus]|uniref:GntR family transcriptional regulator n=1 Tax=Geminicoccus roseus TaxID=404900 RepID=UPI00041BE319|nr:GntR family transcriptional regulator [Geminicoccus roseus]
MPAGLQLEREIFEHILDAIVEGRLPPRTKLAEESLAEIFDVTRARVRKVLLLLAQRGVVRLEPNRGAFVAEPSPAEAAALFEARRIIESQTIVKVAGLDARARALAVARLDAHLDDEAAARAAGEQGRIIRLAGEFHRLVAELAGNQVLAGIIDDLVWRTAVALAAHAQRHDENCPPGEHDAIVQAIRTGDPLTAARRMVEHLHHVAGTRRGS